MYNAAKVTAGVASVITVENCEGNTQTDFIKKYKKLESNPRLDVRLKTSGLQITISPAHNELMTDNQIKNLATDVMKDLNLEEYPWILYRHNDTGHTHYHIVCCRLNKWGKAAKNNFNKLKANKSMHNHAQEYGYYPGRNPEYKIDYKKVKRFNLKNGDTKKQCEHLVKEALSYDFKNYEQFLKICSMLRIKVKKLDYMNGLLCIGTDINGKTISLPISVPLEKEDLNKLNGDELLQYRPDYIQTVSKTEKKVEEAFFNTDSKEAFREYLRGMNIEVILGPKKKNGYYKDITYIDTKTKSVIEHTQFSELFSLTLLNQNITGGNWWEKEKRTAESRFYAEKASERNEKILRKNIKR